MGRPTKSKPHPDADGTDTPEYLAVWSKALVKTAGKREARLTLASYQVIAADKRVAKADRDVARKRAEALERGL